MEDNRSALLLSSADFSKAFNRLEHSACLNAFKQKGASTKVLQLLASFLTGRTMTVKVGQEQPTRRPVDVCAPQGSVLGCFLFNIGIDDIEKNIDNPDTIPATTETQASRHDYPAASTPQRVRPGCNELNYSHIRNEQEIEFLPKATNVPSWLLKPKDPRWREIDNKMEKFVDDSIHMSIVNIRAEPLLKKDGLPYIRRRLNELS